MKQHGKSRTASGRLQPVPNAMAKALASPLFRQRVIKSKKAYKRQQNQILRQNLAKSDT